MGKKSTGWPRIILMNNETLTFAEKLHYQHRFLRYRNRTEPDTVFFIKEEFAPGGVALDIGANKGIVTYFLGKQAGPDGRVIAFEPQPELGQQITKVANTFGLHNVEVHGIGLSDSDGVATLFRGNVGSTANLVAGAAWQKDEVKVVTKSLDSFFAETGLNQLDFVKCDVDGYEAPVLKGAEKVLKRFYPKVLIEIQDRDLPEIGSILKSYGYDDGVFWYKRRRYPASETHQIGYRHPTAKWRNFLFCKRKC
jgi:FkbM family methyltransferase